MGSPGKGKTTVSEAPGEFATSVLVRGGAMPPRARQCRRDEHPAMKPHLDARGPPTMAALSPARLAAIHGGDWLVKLLVVAVIVSVWQ